MQCKGNTHQSTRLEYSRLQNHSSFVLLIAIESESLRSRTRIAPTIADINPPTGIDPERMKSRKALLDAVDGAQKSFDTTEDIRSRDSAYVLISRVTARKRSRRCCASATILC